MRGILPMGRREDIFMPRSDDAAEIRALAYQIWEQEGCPSGREHEHWAQANRIYAELHPADSRSRVRHPREREVFIAADTEIDRLRQALWTPEPFSRELFADEVADERSSWRRRRAASDQTGGDLYGAHEANLVGRRVAARRA
ncbi:DUF2934 domain-containing protein [Aurantimonas sp. 22II-16-19i]|uniref:DUF2934 domain-containing protein n=1 Tax=Aurantimonas sp. 22II-16-19i TaxID=1317114 RepID=UPI001AEC9028|nr:DUF2934 domain-containing protein [Aurantimonas sp. 22II-16-19i]